MKLRKSFTLLLALLLALSALLGACGDSQNTPATSQTTAAGAATTSAGQAATTAAASTAPVKLTFSIWGNDTHVKMYQDMATKFKERYPNVTVEMQTIPFADYQQKLSIGLASKTAPDIAWVAERMIPQYMETNQLLDLSGLRNDSAYGFADVLPSTLELFKKGDQIYGVPFSTPPMLIFYNKSLFKEKGLKTPTELKQEGKWNYDEFFKAAKAITDPAKGVYGVKLVREWKTWSDPMLPLIWAFGGDVFNKETTQFALNSEQGSKAVQTYMDMIFKDGLHPKPGDQLAFETGKIGMYMDRYSNVTKARQVKDFEWDIAPMPAGPSGAATSLGLAGYSIMQSSKHPQEAMAFLKFISNKENMAITSQYFVPSRESVLRSDVFLKAAPQPSAESIQSAVLDQMKEARYSPAHRNWAKIDAAVLTQIDRLYTQSTSVKDALSAMEKEVTLLLKQ